MSVHLFVPRCSENAWSSAVPETELGDFRFVPLDTAQAIADEALATGVPLIGRIASCRRGEARCYSIRAAAGGEPSRCSSSSATAQAPGSRAG